MKLCTIIAVVLLTLSNSFGATDYYVSPTGSTNNNGLSTSTPWPLQYALTTAASGSVVNLMDGTYTSVTTFDILNKTSFTVKSMNKWKAVITGNATIGIRAYAALDDAGAYLAQNVVFDGLCVSNNGTTGIDGGNKTTIRNCLITDNGEVGIIMNDSVASNNIVENCLIELSGHGVWDEVVGHRWHGVYFSGPNNIFRNNVVRHNAGWGIHYYAGVAGTLQRNTHIYNNLTYGHTNFVGAACWNGNDSGGSLLPGTNYVYGNTFIDGLQVALGTCWVTNNIILPRPVNGTENLFITDTATLLNDYNLSTRGFTNSAVTQGPNDVIIGSSGYQGFANTNAGLYWLSADSPARGEALTTVFAPTNFFGVAQSSVSDIGAFQYSQKMERSFKRLDPSGPNGADYWAALTNRSFYIGNLNFR